MRSIKDRFDANRSSGVRPVHSKYIFAFEGYSTEVDYFKGLIDHRNIAGIRDMVSICVLQREVTDSGCSDPLVLLGILQEYALSMAEGRHTPGTFVDMVKSEIGKVMHCGRNDRRLSDLGKQMIAELVDQTDEDGFLKSQDRASQQCEAIIKDRLGKVIHLALPEPEDYNPDTDHICVLVDRDRENHTPQRMDEFVIECKKYGFEPYITNPCFEFWLILHFKRSYKIDKELLATNPMIDGKRFTEVELDRILNEVDPEYHYDKTKLDPQRFMHRVGEAVDNSKTYCTNLKCLKHEVGTNLGLLFEKMCSFR